MPKDTPIKSASSRVTQRKKFALTRLVELIGGAELARRTKLPKQLFYRITSDAQRGRDTHGRIAREHAAEIYDAAGEHIRDVQEARRLLRAQAFSQRRRRKLEDESE